MNHEHLRQLLACYENCTATAAEEAELELALAEAPELPPDLESARRMFAAIGAARFDASIDRVTRSKPRRFCWPLRNAVAAAAASLIIVGGTIGLTHRPSNELSSQEASLLAEQSLRLLATTLYNGASQGLDAQKTLIETTQNTINKIP